MLALTAPLLHSFAALLLAHVVADFILQPGWMVARKRNPLVFLAHIAVVFVLSLGALGGVWEVALFAALAHLIIDMIKVYALPARARDSFTAFVADQGLHLVSLIAIAGTWPGAADLGLLGQWMPDLTPLMLGLSGLILTVTAGGFAV